MSFKSGAIKFTCKSTPKKMVFWLFNKKLKGIAKLIDYEIDFDGRKIQSKVQLEGEEEFVDVCLEDFALLKNEQYYAFVIQQVQSNRPWLNNALTRAILGREIEIPDKHTRLVQDLFSFEFHDSEDENG